MINYLASFFLLLLCHITLHAQSDATPKGMTGFEGSLGTVFVEGENPFLAFLGFSVNGEVDLGLGYSSVDGSPLYTLGTALHFGGELNKAGVALGLGYVIASGFSNYVLYGPSVYANLDAGSLDIIPSLGFQLTTLEGDGFTGVVGFSMVTKGKTAIAFRPVFGFGRDASFIGISAGILARMAK